MEQLIVLAIFFVIWFIGWIGNLGKAKQQQQPPGKGPQPAREPNPAAPADEKLKAEIERFLQEVGVKPAPQQKPPAPIEADPFADRPKPVEPPPVIVREQPRRVEQPKRGPKKPQPQNKKKQPQQPSRPTFSSSTPSVSTFANRTDDLANKHLAVSNVGEAVRDQHLKTNVNAPMQEYLNRRRQGQSHEEAASTLRAQLSPEEIAKAAVLFQEQRTGGKNKTVPVMAMLRNPQTVKQAIIVSEILKRPSRRR